MRLIKRSLTTPFILLRSASSFLGGTMPRLALFLLFLCCSCAHRTLMRQDSYTTLVQLQNMELANTWRVDIPADSKTTYVFRIRPEEPFVIFLSPQVEGEMRILIDSDPGIAYHATGTTTPRSSAHFSSANVGKDPHYDFGGDLTRWQSRVSWSNAQTGGDDSYIVVRNYDDSVATIRLRIFIRPF